MYLNKYYASLERKVTEEVINRAYRNTPFPNADGAIDCYEEHMGEFETIASVRVDSLEEAEQHFYSRYPDILKKDETKVTLNQLKFYFKSKQDENLVLAGEYLGEDELYLIDERALVKDWREYPAKDFTEITEKQYLQLVKN
ncbi:hypothetical protein MZM54_02800 [[Brevibacterium] frigoritolerans]|nr:hypothetical protein [Peribacillus frigoritolerans]